MNRAITHETSAPFTPEQNGFIERDKGTDMVAVKTMLFHQLSEKLVRK